MILCGRIMRVYAHVYVRVYAARVCVYVNHKKAARTDSDVN